MSKDGAIKLFLEKAADSGAQTRLIECAKDMTAMISDLLTEDGLIFCQGVTAKESAVLIPDERRSPDCRSASIAIEEVTGGIAETGTLICSGASRRALQAGMLPEHHVAIVARDNIFESFESFLESCGELPSHLVFVTGPSRTADIEKQLVMGAHGPERVTVIVW